MNEKPNSFIVPTSGYSEEEKQSIRDADRLAKRAQRVQPQNRPQPSTRVPAESESDFA